MNLQLSLVARYLTGRKLRTFLTTLAIVFGVLLVFGTNTIMPAFTRALTANAMAAAGQVDATVSSKSGEAFPESIADRVAGVDGVVAVSGELDRTVNLPADYFDHDPSTPDRVAAVVLAGVDPEAYHSLTAINIVQGRYLEPGDGAVTVISTSLAEVAGVGLGDTLTVPTPTGAVDLHVAGILPQRLLPGNEELLVTLPEAQSLLEMPGQINIVEANFDSVEQGRRRQIEGAIEDELGAGFTIGALQAGAEILQNIGVAQLIISLLGTLGLLMGGFIIFNTFRTIVAERRHDIGMLRAIGASRGRVTWLILAEGLVQGALGTAAGLLLGYGFGVVALRAVAPIGQQYLNIQVGSPIVTPGLVIASILIGVGVTVLAGVIPARLAAGVTPLEALRPSVADMTRRPMRGFAFWSGVVMIAAAVAALLSGNSAFIGLGGVLFILGLIVLAPSLVGPIASLFGSLATWAFARQGSVQLAEGNLTRQPSRAAITASTTMIAMAVLVMGASVLSSISIGFTTMLRKSLSSDYLLVPPSVTVWGTNVGASHELADRLRSIDGVGVVSTLRFAGTKINDVSVGLLGISPEAYTQTSGLTFVQGDAESAYKALESGRAIVVNGILASAASLKMGDEVSLLTPTGTAAYRIVGIASDYLNAKTTTGYISQDNIAADFGRSEDVFYQINLREGADVQAVEAGMKEAIKPYPQFKLVSGSEFLEQNTGIFDAAFAGVYAMMVFLSIPSLIALVNTLAIGVIERTREIGMLRAVGATRSQVRAIILAEALILSAIGTAFGLVSGLYLGYLATSAFSALGFPVEYVFPAGGIVVGIAVGLAFGALAAIIPARQSARLDVVQALRYE